MSDAPRSPATTILIVDDDAIVLDLMRRTLTRDSTQVVAMNDPIQAAALLKQTPHGIQILLTDITMPKLNGIQLAKIARRHCPQIEVLFISGFVDPALADHMPQPVKLLAKPFTPAQLRAFVADIGCVKDVNGQ